MCCLILRSNFALLLIIQFASLFFFFRHDFATILSGPYLWNRYSQRLQIECAAWSCGLILHYCLPSNSLRYLLFFCHDFVRAISLEPLLAETPNWVCCLVLRSNFALLLTIQFASLFFFFFHREFVRRRVFHLRGIAPQSHTGRPRTCLISFCGCSGISGNVSRAFSYLNFSFSLSGLFYSGFFYAGASKTQSLRFQQVFIAKIKRVCKGKEWVETYNNSTKILKHPEVYYCSTANPGHPRSRSYNTRSYSYKLHSTLLLTSEEPI